MLTDADRNLHFVTSWIFFVALETRRQRDKLSFLLLSFCVFVVMAAGFEFSVAIGRMHCACRDEQ